MGKNKNKMKEIEIEITQKQCDELNELHEEIFGGLPEETKKLLGIKEFKPHKFKALFG